MASEQKGRFTYAGAFDSSFDDYARTLAGAPGAHVDPLLYPGAPDHSGLGGDGPYMGTVGVFDSHAAIVAPIGDYAATYAGDLPLSVQPRVTAPDPWDNPELT